MPFVRRRPFSRWKLRSPRASRSPSAPHRRAGSKNPAGSMFPPASTWTRIPVIVVQARTPAVLALIAEPTDTVQVDHRAQRVLPSAIRNG